MELNFFEHNLPGKLITFEGLDGCGKTTQIALLADYLRERGEDVLLAKQPTDTIRQNEIFRAFHDQSEAGHTFDYRALSLLCAADRLQQVRAVILPALAAGKTVISDRYFYSCVANLRVRGFTKDSWIYEIATHMPKPNTAFFLDVGVQTAMERVRRRPAERERWIDVTLEERLRAEYAACEGFHIDTSAEPNVAREKILLRFV